MQQAVFVEAAKAAPAIGGLAYAAATASLIAYVLTGVYAIVQTAYLIWKWRREARQKDSSNAND